MSPFLSVVLSEAKDLTLAQHSVVDL